MQEEQGAGRGALVDSAEEGGVRGVAVAVEQAAGVRVELPEEQEATRGGSEGGGAGEERGVQLQAVEVPEAVLRLLRERAGVRARLQLRGVLEQHEGQRGEAEHDEADPGAEPERVPREGGGDELGGGPEPAALQGVQLQEVELPEEVLRVLPDRGEVLRAVQVRGVQELHHHQPP